MRAWLLVLAAACGPPQGVQQPVPAVLDADEAVEEPPSGPVTAPGVDGTLPFPEYARWVGASEGVAIVALGSRSARREYFGVVDVETGCLVETYARYESVWRALNTTWFREQLAGTRKPDAEDVSAGAFETELVGMIAWLSRFHVTRLVGQMAWSADGTHVLFATTDWMFRSHDGGRTLRRVDGTPSYEPEVSADGRWATFRRCDTRTGRCQYRAAAMALADDRAPAFVGDGDVKDVHLEPDGAHALLARQAGRDLCVERVELASRRVTRVACARTDARSDDVFFVSPNGRFGAVEVVDKVDPPRSGFRLLSLADGRTLRDIRGARSAAPPVDDTGRLGWPEGLPPTFQTHVSDETGDRLVGAGDPIGWDARGHLIVRSGTIAPGPARKLGNPACGLIHAFDAPR